MLGSWAGEAYRKVFTSILQIMNLQKSSLKDAETYDTLEKLFITRNEWDNNIVSITGGRGSGKSSTLNNITNYLRGIKLGNDLFENVGYTDKCTNLLETKITCLGILDPTLFNESDIMEVMISWLFKMFKDKLTHPGKIDVEQKRIILCKFEDIYKYLRTIRTDNGRRMDGDYIETLDILSSTTKLKLLLTELIDMTLCFLDNEALGPKHKATCYKLVVALDDFDQEYSNAYKTMEYIRKYLMLPNVVILIGVNVQDLTSFLTKSMYSELKDEKTQVIGEEYSRAAKMSQNYMQKVIPEIHRIPMPTLECASEDTLVFIEESDHEDYKDYRDHEYQKGSDGREVENGKWQPYELSNKVSTLIYEHAGVLIMPNSEHIKLFSYMSIRDFNGLVELLMESGQHDDDKPRERIATKLLDYLFRWFFKSVVNTYTTEMYDRLKAVIDTESYRRNKLWVKLFYMWLKSIVKSNNTSSIIDYEFERSILKLDPIIMQLIEPLNNPYNVSYADVARIKRLVEFRETDEDMRRTFLFSEIMLSTLCYIEYIRERKNDLDKPFYHGLLTHDPLASDNRDIIYIDDINIINTRIKDIGTSLVKHLLTNVGEQLINAKSLFDKFIFYRYPYPVYRISEGISSQTDTETYFAKPDDKTFKKVVFSIQAYLLSGENKGMLPLRQRELVEYIMSKAKLGLKGTADHVSAHLFEVFFRIGNSLRESSLKHAVPDNSLIAETIDQIKNDEFFQLMQQTCRVRLNVQDSSLSVERFFEFDKEQQVIIRHMVILLANKAPVESSRTNEINILGKLIENLRSDNLQSDHDLIRMLWFVSIYQYILEQEQEFISKKVTTETAAKENTEISVVDFNRIISKKIQDILKHKNKANQITRNTITISNEISGLKKDLFKIKDYRLMGLDIIENISLQLEELRTKSNEMKNQLNNSNLTETNLTWYIEGLNKILSQLQEFVSGRS